MHLGIVVLTSGITYHIFFFWALKYTSPTNTALIIALNPFFTALGEVIIFRNRRSTRFYTGFIISFCGAAWVILSRGSGITAPGIGELFCLISSLSWSFYTIAAKKPSGNPGIRSGSEPTTIYLPRC
jgi:drug/metabolite transporter (DMT)-like permease